MSETERVRVAPTCHYCGERAGITVDHIVPRAFGGPDAMWNYQPSCEPCNRGKAASWPTCGCQKCTEAVSRFLESAERRTKALSRIHAQSAEMLRGIEALEARVITLRGFLASHDALRRLIESKEHDA